MAGKAMKKYIVMILMLMAPVFLFSQEEGKKGAKAVNTNIPVLSQYSENFKIKNLYFNKRIDRGGKGEILEVEFLLENLTDEPMDLYIFTIATYEKKEKTRSSFEQPVPPKERVRTFVTFPDDIANFSYPDIDEKGNVKKDKNGLEIQKLVKYPKNPKSGVNPLTGNPYHLKDRMHIITTHLSPYRMNYYFFNNLAVLVFDSDGKPVYRKLYVIRGKRNR